jgi:putative ABC transport system ATP-binding protein
MKLFEIQDLRVYDGEKEILRLASLSIDTGERLTITGASGGGKSTFLKVLASLQTYQKGNILYEGKNLQNLDPVSYRREVSYCFQQPVLFGKTVGDCLSFPFEIRKQTLDEEKAVSQLTEVNLTSDFLSQELTKLSGGEKQRVALVRNLLFAPKVLLLDEVTTGLDVENKAIVRAFIAHQKATIIEVTHDAEEVASAKRLITIEGGSLKNE